MKRQPLLKILPAVLSPALVLGMISSPAVAQGLTPIQQKQVESMIEELDLALNGGAEKNNARALARCQAAAKSPKAAYDFFMEATRKLDFDEAGKRESDWREWRDRNEDRHKSSGHLAARQFQLRYLVLTLKLAAAKQQKTAIREAIPDLLAYYDLLADHFEKLEEHHRVLSEPVLESVFARNLKLDVSLHRTDGWVYAPLPVSSVYEQVILPHYREAKNHRALQAAWDKRIVQESMTLAAEGTEPARPTPAWGSGGRRFLRDQRDREREERQEENRQQKVSEASFRSERLPELQWGKEQDNLLFGPDRPAAFAALGRILRENLAHRQATTWLGELKALARGDRKTP